MTVPYTTIHSNIDRSMSVKQFNNCCHKNISIFLKLCWYSQAGISNLVSAGNYKELFWQKKFWLLQSLWCVIFKQHWLKILLLQLFNSLLFSVCLSVYLFSRCPVRSLWHLYDQYSHLSISTWWWHKMWGCKEHINITPLNFEISMWIDLYYILETPLSSPYNILWAFIIPK